jgi:beta-glucosidase
VSAWATLNEPWCSAFLGYGNGHHAPGLTNTRYATQAMHHLLLGHGLALERLQAHDPATPRGIVANIGRGGTLGDSAADHDAVRMFELQHNDWVLRPLLKGEYPQELFDRLWPGSAPLVLDSDMAIISRPNDFLGINYYFRGTVRDDGRGGFDMVERPGVEVTQMGWEVHPQGLEELLVRFHAEFPNLPPIYITENGMASDDHVVEGQVDDAQRQSYLQRHFSAVGRAMDAGVDVRGYYVWSLMDNFEWAFGYERRFGLVHVDYATQQRTLKDSARHRRAYLRDPGRQRPR